MANTYTLSNGKSIAGMTQAIEKLLKDRKNMQTQVVTMDSGSTIVQARINNGKFKQWVGLDKAITVRMDPLNERNVIVDIGQAKWGDKTTVMIISMFVLWPLSVTSGIGFFQQSQLPKAITEAVQDYLIY